MLKEKIQEVIAKSEEQFIAEQQSKKIINKGYRLVADLTEYPRNIIETVESWMAEKKNETCTNEEWHQLFENEKKVIVPKGQLFFRSKLYSDKDGIYYLYPSDVDVSVLDKKDKSLGLGVYYETNKYKLWEDYLSWKNMWFKDGVFEEVETGELTFEQVHIVDVFNQRKKYLINEIAEKIDEIERINTHICTVN